MASEHRARTGASGTREGRRADATRQFLVGVFDQAEPDANLGKPITAKQLLDQGEQQLAAGSDLESGTRLDLTVLIAHLYWDLDDYAHAEPLLKGAVASASDPRVPDEVRARTLMTIAKVESQKRKFADAIEHAKLAIAAAARAGRAGDDAASEARRVIAISLHGQDDSKEAEPFLRAALAADRSLYGDRNEAVLNDWIELGDELTELSRFDEAVAALRNAVDLARALHGPVHSTVANTLQELSAALGYAGDFAQSERLQREAYEIFAKVYGPEHYETMTARGNLMWTLEHEARFEEALAGRIEMRDAMEHLTTTRPELMASNYTSIGVNYARLGRLDEAETAIRQALATWAKLQGSSDNGTCRPDGATRGHLALARPSCRRRSGVAPCDSDRTEARAASSGWLNRDRSYLGDILRMQHRYDDALRETRAAVEARGDAKPDPIQCALLSRLSLAQLDSGDAELAHKTATDGVAMARSLFPAGHFKLGAPVCARSRRSRDASRRRSRAAIARGAEGSNPRAPAD